MIRKFRYLLFVACLLLLCGCKEKPKEVCDADFDASMGKNSPEWQSLCSHRGNTDRLNKLKTIYELNKPSAVTRGETPKIPKIIHQIWLGPKSPPNYFWDYGKTWQQKHPGWEYHLWTDRDVAELDFDLKDLYMQSTNWGEKSDILRSELLDRFGGMYVDTDFECLKPFDELHLKYDFYAGLEPPHDADFTSTAPHVTISNALIGSAPHHPVILEWKRLMRLRWDELEQKFPDSHKRVLLRTFYPFGEATAAKIDTSRYTNIVFPATFFYPLTFSEFSKGRMKKLSFIKKMGRNLMTFFNLKKPTPFVEIQPETMAIHYWGNSWLKSNEERFREMYKQIVELQKEFRREVSTLQEEINQLNDRLKEEKVCANAEV